LEEAEFFAGSPACQSAAAITAASESDADTFGAGLAVLTGELGAAAAADLFVVPEAEGFFAAEDFAA